jgi:NAD(P)-dependent dehydrogenase (short-subunit alcohol dehydrogenase family)
LARNAASRRGKTLSSRDELPLSGKRALVTGGARRIGREIAITLGRAGADVAITYLTSLQDARDTVDSIQSFGVRGFAFQCDLREPAKIRSLAQDAIERLGKLDLLINNAGLYQTKKFDEIAIGEWDEAFAVNVRAPFLLTQACSTELRRRRGRVVNIGSLGGLRPWATHAHYCASKAALHMLTQVSAKALGPEVTVNCVAPGMIDQGESLRSETLARFLEKTPMKKNGSAADVAQSVLFFATSPDFITGQILTVDGGLSLA